MKASQLREFDFGVVAATMIVGGQDLLDVDSRGYLDIPQGTKPAGFNLVVAVEKGERRFTAQKNVSKTGGGYDSQALSKLANFPKSFQAVVMHDAIKVKSAGPNVWTDWHADTPNRIDIFHVGKNGEFGLYQVGIFTHDDGKTFHLFGEPRWLGTLYKLGNEFVAVPEHPKWGSFEGGTSNRIQIFQHPEFIALAKSAKLKEWKGLADEVEPPLPKVLKGQAVIAWFITFASQKGAGIAVSANGSTAWVQASDIVGLEPEEDGEIRLWSGDVISFEDVVYNWGKKQDSPPKLTGVRLVKRSW